MNIDQVAVAHGIGLLRSFDHKAEFSVQGLRGFIIGEYGQFDAFGGGPIIGVIAHRVHQGTAYALALDLGRDGDSQHPDMLPTHLWRLIQATRTNDLALVLGDQHQITFAGCKALSEPLLPYRGIGKRHLQKITKYT